MDCTDATEDLSQAQLNATGDLDLVLFGLLEVDTNFDITGNQSIATNAIVTINYR